MNLVRLATTLKKLRQDRGLTLEEVASRAGLTRGWLSKVENFRVTPSLQALGSISAALDVPLSQIFEGIDSRPALTVTRRGEGVVMRRDEEVSKLVYESLARDGPDLRLANCWAHARRKLCEVFDRDAAYFLPHPEKERIWRTNYWQEVRDDHLIRSRPRRTRRPG